jgi:prepilin peptidase CpaA
VIGTVLLVGLLLACSWTDLRWGRIPNGLTYSGMLLALVGSLLQSFSNAGLNWRPLWGNDFPGWTGAVTGFLICGGLMVICYAIFAGQVGGGDVKLLAMIGAFLGPYGGLEALIWTLMFGAAFALIRLVWLMGVDRILHKLLRYLLTMLRARHWVQLDDEDREPLKTQLYLAPSALLGVLWALWVSTTWKSG